MTYENEVVSLMLQLCPGSVFQPGEARLFNASKKLALSLLSCETTKPASGTYKVSIWSIWQSWDLVPGADGKDVGKQGTHSPTQTLPEFTCWNFPPFLW